MSNPPTEEMSQKWEEINGTRHSGDVAETWYSKRIRLSENYRIDLRTAPGTEAARFGISGDIGPTSKEKNTFLGTGSKSSAQIGPKSYKRTGMLSFQERATQLGWEIMHMGL